MNTVYLHLHESCLFRSPIIQSSLALKVYLSTIPQNEIALKLPVITSSTGQYSVTASRTSNQARSLGLDAVILCKEQYPNIELPM
jgi:hypothetical protein